MTGWHIALIAGSGAAVLAIMALVHRLGSRAPTIHIEEAPEAEADRRFTTTVQKGRNNFIL